MGVAVGDYENKGSLDISTPTSLTTTKSSIATTAKGASPMSATQVGIGRAHSSFPQLGDGFSITTTTGGRTSSLPTGTYIRRRTTRLGNVFAERPLLFQKH